jgi:hypothetical protein
VTMFPVPTRVLLAVGAWLAGVGAATGGSLAAVSLIGQGLAGTPTQQLTVSAVNQALASGDREAGPAGAAHPAPSRTAGRRGVAASPHTRAGDAATPDGTLLSSAGGTLLASCGPAGAYLISWSPGPGYQAEDVTRGPAGVARVFFTTGQQGIRMLVSCRNGTPVSAVSEGGDDDGGEPGDS